MKKQKKAVLNQDLILAFRGELIDWFLRNQRDFPWRQDRTPYRVWVSELMLQQTRTDQVQPYYERFMERFPSVEMLAEASRDEVLKLWEGLGYYSRAHRMHDTAQLLVAERGAVFPDSVEGLRELPGIGPYAAAAIGSLAMGLPSAVVDGNVMRVLSRVMAYGESIDKAKGKRQISEWAQELLPVDRPGPFNEGIMELGATICLPRKPNCSSCPLASCCKAHAAGNPLDYPERKAKAKVPTLQVGAAVLMDDNGRVLIAQRKAGDMLAGLWEFPGGKQEAGESMKQCISREIKEELDVEIAVGDELIVVKHAYSHFKIVLHAHFARVTSGRLKAIDCADFVWIELPQMADYAMSKADHYVRDALLANS